MTTPTSDVDAFSMLEMESHGINVLMELDMPLEDEPYATTKCSPASTASSSSCSTAPTCEADIDAYTHDMMLMGGDEACTAPVPPVDTSALLSLEHTGLDTALLREMEELLSMNARENAQHWGQFRLDSPSLRFPMPERDSPKVAAVAVPPAPVAAFVPAGSGWNTAQTPTASVTEDIDDAAESDVEMEMEADEDTELVNAGEKRETELLLRQLKFLQAQRDFLEYKADFNDGDSSRLTSDEITLRQRAAEEKARVVESQVLRDMLAKLATQQLENLKHMELLLLQSPLNHYRMTLMTPMESFIHLTRDPVERRATLLSLRDAKIDNVVQFIEYQARNIDLERQFFYLDTFEKFGKFYTVDFSINKLDGTTVEEVVTILYNHFVTTNDTISQVLGSVENREYFDGMENMFLNARFVDRICLPKRHKGDKGFVVQESNTVYYIKHFGDRSVLMCDYIDRDDLHPYRSTGRIRKDKTVGVIVEPHVDAQGHKSVIMKRFSFIKHHFKQIEPTPALVQAISTKVILWGQAVRFCLAGRRAGLRRPEPVMAAQLHTRSSQVSELSLSSR